MEAVLLLLLYKKQKESPKNQIGHWGMAYCEEEFRLHFFPTLEWPKPQPRQRIQISWQQSPKLQNSLEFSIGK